MTRVLPTRGLLLVAGALVALAVPASALAVTPASFEVTGGALSISAPAGTNVDLGSRLASSQSGTISGQLGVVTVSDLRGGPTTWTASVIASAFTPTEARPSPQPPSATTRESSPRSARWYRSVASSRT